MDPLPPTTPPLLHPRCILSWDSRNLSKQLLFDSGSSSLGAFFLVDMGPGAAVGSMRIEINTGMLRLALLSTLVASSLAAEFSTTASFIVKVGKTKKTASCDITISYDGAVVNQADSSA